MDKISFDTPISKEDFEKFFWNRYLIYENDFINSFNYVDFSRDTFNTYSTYYIKLFLTNCIEIESILKLIFGSKKFSTKKNKDVYKNMTDFMDNLFSAFPNISNNKVICKEYDMEFYPLKIEDGKDVPIWWTNYNDVKHNRFKNYKSANLGNTTYSLSCLFLLNMLCFREISDQKIWLPKKISSIFTTDLQPENILDLGNGLYFVPDFGEIPE